jgi:hypothetical protein
MAVPVPIFTLPIAALVIGVSGPFASGQVGGSFSAYQVQVNPDITWPTTGTAVLEITIERSIDGGATWLFDAKVIHGATNLTSLLTTISMGTLGPDPAPTTLTTSTTDLFRITLNALRLCAPTITFLGVP